MSSLDELDLVSCKESFIDIDLCGGSGLLLPCFVFVGEVSDEESPPTINACSRGDAGASLGDKRRFSEGDNIGEVGDKGLDIEFRDSLLPCLLYMGFVGSLGGTFFIWPFKVEASVSVFFDLDFVYVNFEPGWSGSTS